MSGVIAGAVIGGVIGFGGGTYGVSKYNRELTRAYKKQMKYVVQNYNFNQQALTTEERYLLDNAKQQLFNISLNGIQNNATVEAALAETGTEGRTSGQIMRSIEGQQERRQTAVMENYYQTKAQIGEQKSALYIQTQRSIDQARENLKDQYKTGMAAVMEVLQSTAQGAAMGAFTGGVAGAWASGGQTLATNTATQGLNAANIASKATTTATTATSATTAAAGSSGSSMSLFGAMNMFYEQYGGMMQGFNMLNSSLSNMSNQFSQGRRTYNFIY